MEDGSANTIYSGGAICCVDFTMYGGTIYGGVATNNGGAVYAENFKMYGGEIIGGTAITKFGGAVYATNFEMIGGKITGGTAVRGGAVNASYFKMTGGEIIGGIADKGTSTESYAGLGSAVFGYYTVDVSGGSITDGDVAFSDKATEIKIGGKAVIENLLVAHADKTVTVNGLTDGANVTITAKDELLGTDGIVIATGVADTDRDYIYCAEGYRLIDDGAGTLYLAKVGATAAVLSIDMTEATIEATTEATRAATEAAATESAAQ